MTKNLDIINAAVSLIIKAALLAARFSGRVRKRSLKRLASMDADTKDKEIIFLRDKVHQLKMQVSILVVIDHFSRKVMSVTPLEGPNSGWIINALESTIQKHGAPKHIISDQASIFTGDAFAELLDNWNVKPRFGAIGKHGSIPVTERVIKTLKYEWLERVPSIKGFDHLTLLCKEFGSWYNSWQPHMSLDGVRPDDVYYDKKPKKPERDSKTVPCNIEHRLSRETRITGYRLKSVA